MTWDTDLLDVFAPIKWAAPFLKNPDLCVRRRTRVASSQVNSDPISMLARHDEELQWHATLGRVVRESHPPGSKLISRSITLCKCGPGLMSFLTICHGGAVMTMMDEALAFANIANDTEATGKPLRSGEFCRTLQWG
ncbi:hypothetical protein K458DRAFT_413695 [Lentithecium fluviatile CBS 122367]|uniref:Thioesterase domain-containing protein n=1 Tax=Lentithecium fluviatile CBS 122367 TaxID=1168545 RepID=A0A6G1JFR7_9PLEO|nr:hypothetical protein K458DRAFT_413695 [Lentithecium fluviatile CBS 122367]